MIVVAAFACMVSGCASGAKDQQSVAGQTDLQAASVAYDQAWRDFTDCVDSGGGTLLSQHVNRQTGIREYTVSDEHVGVVDACFGSELIDAEAAFYRANPAIEDLELEEQREEWETFVVPCLVANGEDVEQDFDKSRLLDAEKLKAAYGKVYEELVPLGACE